MKINSVKTYIAGALLAGGAALMTGCSESEAWNNSSRLHQYMAERGDTQAALDSILDLTKHTDYVKESVMRQSAVDSIAYRDMLLGSRGAKVPAIVNEFNKIAAKASLLNVSRLPFHSTADYQNKAMELAAKEGILITEADKFLREFPNEAEYKNFGKYAADVQQYVDKHFYETFFKRNRLISGNMKANLDSIAVLLKR